MQFCVELPCEFVNAQWPLGAFFSKSTYVSGARYLSLLFDHREKSLRSKKPFRANAGCNNERHQNSMPAHPNTGIDREGSRWPGPKQPTGLMAPSDRSTLEQKKV